MIKIIIRTWSALGQRFRSFQQNGLLGNRSKNFKKFERLSLQNLSAKRLVDWGSIKAKKPRMHGK